MTGVLIVAALLGAAPALAEATTLFTDLVGTEVRDARGERLGEIKDVLFDARDGAIVALTVDYGRWLRVSEYEAAFAPRLFTRDGDAWQLRAAETTLRRTPAVERPAWPLLRASDLVGREVRDRLRRDSGEMVDLVLDLDAGRVEWALIDLRDDWEPRAVVRRVSLEQLALPHEVGQYPTLTVTRERCC